jgi:signal transduction histidine kinase
MRWMHALPCLILAGTAAFAPAGAAAEPQVPAWRVVLIRGWDSLYPVNLVRESALREALLDQAPRAIEFFPEEIDPLRFPESVEGPLVDLLTRKYSATSVDLVVASGIEQLQFAARHRDAIWPGAAIVFNGVFDGSLEGWQRPPRTAGVTVALDIEHTLSLGRALTPGARHLHVVSGTAPFDRHLLDLAVRKLDRLDAGLELHYVVGLSRRDAAARLAALQPDSLVLYLTMLRDADGRVSGPGVPALQSLAASSAVPVLSPIQTQFGRGPVGGSSPRYDDHGRAAGRIGRRLLEGEDADRIAVRSEPSPSCEVDWNALKRWGLAERNVPSTCRIANRPPNLVHTYLWPLLALVSIIILQGVLIWSLMLQSRRRRRAEAELLAQSAEIAQVARMSMVGALTASIAHEINQPMGAILSNTEAAQMMLEQGTLDSDQLREILADIRSEDLRASEVIRGLRKLLARTPWNPSALQLNLEVAEALRLVAFEAARRGVRLVRAFDGELPQIMGDAVQLQQVVINLVVNAMDAVADLDERVREVRIDTRMRADGAEITVADRGPGLASADAQRLFHSNFTTKKDGMGFGLAIVRGIMEMHSGRVSYEPNVPRGAIFRVWLPAIAT